MPKDRTDPFRIGVTRDVRRPDGSFVFAPHDLGSLEVDGIEWQFLAEDARPLRPSLLAGLDGLYHFSAPVDAEQPRRCRPARDPCATSASTSSTSRPAPIVASPSRSPEG